ncbi:MAG: transglycosylase domain-containing protein [Silvanigrellaceae bacterium]
MNKMVVGLVAAGSLLVAPPIALGGFAFFEVVGGNYDHLKKERILEILSKETMLYYSDGTTQLGSLFGSEHRQYMRLKEIPKLLQQGVVAAEDDEFYKHRGINVLSTARAAFRNIVMGKREGASTITQQTVKNLYGRPVTNLRAKFEEAINAFKMERRFSKDEILEFYLNQFHVTGNGRGVGVAAKYYFDKDAQELTLTEAAFIAGSVKGPERYNPFTKRAAAAQTKAKLDAKIRKNYVLKRMLDNKFITAKEFEEASKEEVPFKQGKFQFNELFITELVQRQLARKEVLTALGAENAEEVGSMGLRITTTLDQAVQQGALYGVRQNLSRLEMILTGFEKSNAAQFVSIQRPDVHSFYVGKLLQISKEKTKESATVSLGVPECFVPSDAIERVAKITDQALYRGLDKSKAALLSQLNVGDFVLVSVREQRPDGRLVCDLERQPRIQGAAIVLDKGQVVAMVGGYAPHEYNRAVFAKRQPGSTFKTLTYYPALQLGWHILEPLLNTRNVYTWQGQFYYPRPDHSPETLETTFAGAGAKSENLASVWLLAHLLDRLTFSQFKDLLVTLEMAKSGENESDVANRLAAKYNARLVEPNLRAGLFGGVKNELLEDVTLAQDKMLRTILRSMNFGTGFEAETARVAAAKPKSMPEKEKLIRLQILKNNFLRWDAMRDQARAAIEKVKSLAQNKALLTKEDLVALAPFYAVDRSIVFQSSDPFDLGVVTPLLETPKPRVLKAEEVVSLAESNISLFSEENVLLDGLVPMSLIAELKEQVEVKYKSIADSGPMEKLFWHDDFRYSLGMIYAQFMTRQMGIESDVQWVPSFPLGANVVSLAELALSYQSILEGKTYRYFNTEQENQLLLIKRIEDEQGNLLWEADQQEHQLVDEFFTSQMMSVLRGTVTNGTARAANRTVVLRSKNTVDDAVLEKAGLRIPTFGKTGTTNDYVNATYVGFLPYPEDSGSSSLSAKSAYTIAAYVGYDTNEPMRRRGFKVAGGTGALPAWIEIAQTLIREQKFSEKLNWKPMVEKKFSEIPFEFGSDVQRITVPVYGASIANSDSDSDDSDNSRADLNALIDDYATSRNSLLRVALAGRYSDGLFVPTRRVSPLSVRVKNHETKEQLLQPPTSDAVAPGEKKDDLAGPMGNSLPPPPGDMAKNAVPAATPTPGKDNLHHDFPIPKFKIDDTFNSEDPIN